jgi:CRP-like cAMP-binding protein
MLGDDIDDIRRALRAIHRISDVLGSDQLDALAEQCLPAFFLAGAVVMRQGDFGASMFGIVEGVVSVTFTDRLDRETEVTQLRAGNVVGEMALLTGDPRTATVRAVTDVSALEITKPALQQAFAASPDLVERFAEVLAFRKAMLDQVAADHARLTDQFMLQIRRVFSGLLGAGRAD